MSLLQIGLGSGGREIPLLISKIIERRETGIADVITPGATALRMIVLMSMEIIGLKGIDQAEAFLKVVDAPITRIILSGHHRAQKIEKKINLINAQAGIRYIKLLLPIDGIAIRWIVIHRQIVLTHISIQESIGVG